MPITPKILEDLNKGNSAYSKERGNLDITIVDTKSPYTEVVVCPACNLVMLPTTDKFTGRKNGFMCPSCGKVYDPEQQLNKVEVKKQRQLTTEDHAINETELAGRRGMESIQTEIEGIRDNLYTPKAVNTSIAKVFEQRLGYAGKKKQADSDEQLLKSHGFTILESQERNP